MPSKADRLRAAGPTELRRADQAARVSEIRRIDDVRPNPDQPRRSFDDAALASLADSIRRHGIINPIAVDESGQIIAGERRYRAAKIAGLTAVPVAVFADRSAWELSLAENMDRADLHPLEIAWTLAEAQRALNLSGKDLAARVHMAPDVLSETLRVLDLPDDLQKDWIGRGQFPSKSQVLSILRRSTPDTIHAAWSRLVGGGTDTSVRHPVGGTGTLAGHPPKPPSPTTVASRVRKLRESTLSAVRPDGWKRKSRAAVRSELVSARAAIDALLSQLPED